MLYRKFHDLQISSLGLCDKGLLAVSELSDEEALAEAEALYAQAFGLGVNYFEVAQGYARKDPLKDAGKILGRYPRDSFYLASGFPGYDMQSFEKPEELFAAQLEALQTDRLDFYLLYYVSEFNLEKYLDPACGVTDFFIRMKQEGKIRFLGCSFLGNAFAMRQFLDRYGGQIDFCQFSLNWMDWDLHAAKQKIRICRDRQLPVWAEDPLKKGLLETLSEEPAAKLAEGGLGADASLTAYRYLQSLPEAAVTLLERPKPEQLQKAADSFQTEHPTTEEENRLLYETAKAMMPKKLLNCTGCRRCMKHCIKFLDIAGFMELHNEELVSGYSLETPMYVYAYPVEKQPQSCCHWGPCQSVCPQKLDIIRMMLKLSTRARRNPFVR